ncbi:MAG: methionine synthase, partial [Firmicutes bacterium]|nr:methionine synthase [Bacillota bacterium]
MAKGLQTTSVGSFPKPAALLSARAKFRRGEISAEALAVVEREATKQVMDLQ